MSLPVISILPLRFPPYTHHILKTETPMKNIALLIAIMFTTLFAATTEVQAVPAFAKAFKARVIDKSKNAEFVTAATAAKCNVCHFATPESKSKKQKNDFGKELAKHLSKKNYTSTRIREEAEEEEREFYSGKAPPEWIEALEHLGTDEHKPFLETAPWLIVIFAESYELMDDGTKAKNYYVSESVGIATGMLVTACHHAGLVTLTHTPSPMKFLNEVLERPANERAFLILVCGYPDEAATVPDITKKSIDEIAVFVE